VANVVTTLNGLAVDTSTNSLDLVERIHNVEPSWDRINREGMTPMFTDDVVCGAPESDTASTVPSALAAYSVDPSGLTATSDPPVPVTGILVGTAPPVGSLICCTDPESPAKSDPLASIKEYVVGDGTPKTSDCVIPVGAGAEAAAGALCASCSSGIPVSNKAAATPADIFERNRVKRELFTR